MRKYKSRSVQERLVGHPLSIDIFQQMHVIYVYIRKKYRYVALAKNVTILYITVIMQIMLYHYNYIACKIHVKYINKNWCTSQPFEMSWALRVGDHF